MVGDYENGNIYALDLNTYDDNGVPQKWLRSWRALPTGKNDLKRTTQHSLQLDCESGVGLNQVSRFPDDSMLGVLLTESGFRILTESGDGLIVTDDHITMDNPYVMLRWSDDGGHTWSNEHFAYMGGRGDYQARAIWRRLGMTLKLRDRVYEVSGTDPVKVSIMGAELILSPTNG